VFVPAEPKQLGVTVACSVTISDEFKCQKCDNVKKQCASQPGVVAHAYNPSTQKAEAGGF
jgi:hypothetical protein